MWNRIKCLFGFHMWEHWSDTTHDLFGTSIKWGRKCTRCTHSVTEHDSFLR